MLSRRVFQRSRLIGACCVVLVCLALPSCDEDPTETDYYTNLRISKASGDGQSERTGAQLAEPLVVEVTNILQDPQQGIEVTFSSTAPGSAVLTPNSVTNESGRSFCYFVLGTETGTQQVKAVIETDSTAFSVEAVPLDCDEEDPSASADWDSNKIYYVTTSSTLLEGAGSVLAMFDPETNDDPTEILETPHILTDVAFSSRGELFVASSKYIYKVNADTKQLEQYAYLNMAGHVELDANAGGILAGISYDGPFAVGCGTAAELCGSTMFLYLQPENFAADPVSRDLFFIHGDPTYWVYRLPWDGRSVDDISPMQYASFYEANNEPRGMCIDYSGSIYVVIDGMEWTTQRIVKINPSGEVVNHFFDFEDAPTPDRQNSRFGDITLLNGSLFLINTYRNSIVEIGTDGIWVGEFTFEYGYVSRPGTSGEPYGIAAKLQPPETAP